MGAYFKFKERRIEKALEQNSIRGFSAPPAPEQDHNATDRRRAIPAKGLREYWYPLIHEDRVGFKKPLYWRICGEELALFRDHDGKVAAVSDVCPHRGASVSQGDCYYKGTVTCPYHGATWDKTGDCKAFIPEGPDSKMVGNLPIKAYPTQTHRGWVFIWMGDGEAAPIEDDIPPEFLDLETTSLFHSTTYWEMNWIVSIENQNDSHNGFFVHRNSLMQLMSPRMRARTPVGPRSKLLQDRALTPLMQNQRYYLDDKGNMPYQLRHEGVGGVWPLSTWRKHVWKLFSPWYRFVIYNKWRLDPKRYPLPSPEEWAGVPGASAWHLPSAIRVNAGLYLFTRYAVPVEENLSRIIYFHHRPKPKTIFGKIAQWIWFHGYFNYWLNYNFSGQDGVVAAPTRYWTKENLAPTDSHMSLLRKLVTERSRDAKRRVAAEKAAAAASGEATAVVAKVKDDVDLDAAAAENAEMAPLGVILHKRPKMV